MWFVRIPLNNEDLMTNEPSYYTKNYVNMALLHNAVRQIPLLSFNDNYWSKHRKVYTENIEKMHDGPIKQQFMETVQCESGSLAKNEFCDSFKMNIFPRKCSESTYRGNHSKKMRERVLSQKLRSQQTILLNKNDQQFLIKKYPKRNRDVINKFDLYANLPIIQSLMAGEYYVCSILKRDGTTFAVQSRFKSELHSIIPFAAGCIVPSNIHSYYVQPQWKDSFIAAFDVEDIFTKQYIFIS